MATVAPAAAPAPPVSVSYDPHNKRPPAAGQHRAQAITGKLHQRPPAGAASSPRATAAASSPHGHRGPLQLPQRRPGTGSACSWPASSAGDHRQPPQRSPFPYRTIHITSDPLQLVSIERRRSPASCTSGPLPGPRAHPGPPLPPVPPMATVAPCSCPRAARAPAAPAAGQHRARAITGKPHQRPPAGAASSPRATAATSSPHGHRGPMRQSNILWT